MDDNEGNESGLERLLGYTRIRAPVSRAMDLWFADLYEQNFNGNETVLEVGSGLNALSINLPEHHGKWVHFDLDTEALKEAKKISPDGIYVAGTGLELPFEDESFDVVCGFNCYELLTAYQDQAFTEASRVLRKDGLFLHLQDLATPLIVQSDTGEIHEETEIDPNERFKVVSSIMCEYLSRHFNPDTINSEVKQYNFKGKRTELQRRGGRYTVFSYNFGQTATSLMAGYGTKEQPMFYKGSPKREAYYSLIRPIFPWLASKIEPPTFELITVGQITARK